jgi:hypothetical protein
MASTVRPRTLVRRELGAMGDVPRAQTPTARRAICPFGHCARTPAWSRMVVHCLLRLEVVGVMIAGILETAQGGECS